jgi:hypothetical protein
MKFKESPVAIMSYPDAGRRVEKGDPIQDPIQCPSNVNSPGAGSPTGLEWVLIDGVFESSLMGPLLAHLLREVTAWPMKNYPKENKNAQ